MMHTTPAQRRAVDARTRPPGRMVRLAVALQRLVVREREIARLTDENAHLRVCLDAANRRIDALLAPPAYYTSDSTTPRPQLVEADALCDHPCPSYFDWGTCACVLRYGEEALAGLGEERGRDTTPYRGAADTREGGQGDGR